MQVSGCVQLHTSLLLVLSRVQPSLKYLPMICDRNKEAVLDSALKVTGRLFIRNIELSTHKSLS